ELLAELLRPFRVARAEASARGGPQGNCTFADLVALTLVSTRFNQERIARFFEPPALSPKPRSGFGGMGDRPNPKE
ncbi:hypothetical protein, partial [uncultured Rikenella sp.]|uniref:hypothetical protein n=1 Tax=uncultured Rikenella sp. TaxID=368003 RepID=UPI002601D67C